MSSHFVITVCGIRLFIISMILTYALSEETKCVQIQERSNGRLFICNATAKMRTFSACCFNAELNYHYCCSPTEFSSMTQLKRVGGALIGGALIIVLILLLCFFSNRCPIRRAICNRRARSSPQTSANAANVS